MTTLISEPRTIGILGAGRVGTAAARQALQAGYEVRIATAKPAEEIAELEADHRSTSRLCKTSSPTRTW